MVLDKVRNIIAETLGSRLSVEKNDIDENTEFVSDLHTDSVDIASIICDIEDEFDIEIDEDELEGIETVGDVVTRIEDMTE